MHLVLFLLRFVCSDVLLQDFRLFRPELCSSYWVLPMYGDIEVFHNYLPNKRVKLSLSALKAINSNLSAVEDISVIPLTTSGGTKSAS